MSRGYRKSFVGNVVSDKMDKTVVVEVPRRYMHPVYKKYITGRKTYKAHAPNNDCQVGDRVRIVETRPLSSNKCWRVKEIIEKARVQA